MTGAATTAFPAAPADSTRSLPGGAHVHERWTAPGRVLITVAGRLDDADRNALLDTITGSTLMGADDVTIDLRGAHLTDVSLLHLLHRVHRFLSAAGGRLAVEGLTSALEESWTHATSSSPHPRRIGAPRGDER